MAFSNVCFVVNVRPFFHTASNDAFRQSHVQVLADGYIPGAAHNIAGRHRLRDAVSASQHRQGIQDLQPTAKIVHPHALPLDLSLDGGGEGPAEPLQRRVQLPGLLKRRMNRKAVPLPAKPFPFPAQYIPAAGGEASGDVLEAQPQVLDPPPGVDQPSRSFLQALPLLGNISFCPAEQLAGQVHISGDKL
jgi:hypothetical protein